ncbi:hypothetical protein H4W34_005540 [Actinomadura algeriensis]|uniref:Uncharacterized protein n=1 Tax=Actinomadura algeriensis TaxID=1679523 RepID=A0ABR9JYP4_9ACTN|nr:hypothetical protein [Actinomadura algeriensis]
MNELPGELLPPVLADEIITIEGWRLDLIEGDRN